MRIKTLPMRRSNIVGNLIMVVGKMFSDAVFCQNWKLAKYNQIRTFERINYVSLKKRIRQLLLSHRRFGPMARIDDGFIGQCENLCLN